MRSISVNVSCHHRPDASQAYRGHPPFPVIYKSAPARQSPVNWSRFHFHTLEYIPRSSPGRKTAVPCPAPKNIILLLAQDPFPNPLHRIAGCSRLAVQMHPIPDKHTIRDDPKTGRSNLAISPPPIPPKRNYRQVPGTHKKRINSPPPPTASRAPFASRYRKLPDWPPFISLPSHIKRPLSPAPDSRATARRPSSGMRRRCCRRGAWWTRRCCSSPPRGFPRW